MPVQSYLDTCLVLLVTITAINDVATRRIPNRLLLVGFLIALPLHAMSPAPAAGLASAVAGALTGLAIFLPFYFLRGMAAGDVKLMATVGAFAGPVGAFQIAMLSWCVGGVIALLIMVCKGRVRTGLSNLGALLRPWLMRVAGMQAAHEPLPHASVGSMPYGLAIALGALLFLHAGRL